MGLSIWKSIILLAQQVEMAPEQVGGTEAIQFVDMSAKQGFFDQIEAALSGVFGNALTTFNIFFERPNAIVMGAMILGLLYLVFGWKLYKISLVVFGLLVGSLVGFGLGEWFGSTFGMNPDTTAWIGAVALGLVLGGLAIPFVKLMVFVSCGLSGAVLVSYLCERIGLGSSWLWTLASFLIIGFLSVFLIKFAMILSTSLCGSYVIVAGAAALLHGFRGISVSTKTELILPMAIWVLLFLLGIRTQMAKTREKHGG